MKVRRPPEPRHLGSNIRPHWWWFLLALFHRAIARAPSIFRLIIIIILPAFASIFIWVGRAHLWTLRATTFLHLCCYFFFLSSLYVQGLWHIEETKSTLAFRNTKQFEHYRRNNLGLGPFGIQLHNEIEFVIYLLSFIFSSPMLGQILTRNLYIKLTNTELAWRKT